MFGPVIASILSEQSRISLPNGSRLRTSTAEAAFMLNSQSTTSIEKASSHPKLGIVHPLPYAHSRTLHPCYWLPYAPSTPPRSHTHHLFRLGLMRSPLHHQLSLLNTGSTIGSMPLPSPLLLASLTLDLHHGRHRSPLLRRISSSTPDSLPTVACPSFPIAGSLHSCPSQILTSDYTYHDLSYTRAQLISEILVSVIKQTKYGRLARQKNRKIFAHLMSSHSIWPNSLFYSLFPLNSIQLKHTSIPSFFPAPIPLFLRLGGRCFNLKVAWPWDRIF